MADKRMFNRKVIESDLFLSLSYKAQTLYFHLSMNADDEGFINNAKSIMAMCGCDDDDLEDLIATGYLLQVYPTVLVIRHWYLNNNIPKDRFHSTIIPNWKTRLELVDKVYEVKAHIM